MRALLLVGLVSLAAFDSIRASQVASELIAQGDQARRDAVRAGEGPVDDPLAVPSGLEVHDVALSEALVLLARESGVRLAFSPSFIPPGHEVSCSCEHLSADVTLGILLEGTGLRHRIAGRHVLIEPVPVSDPTIGPARLDVPVLNLDPTRPSADMDIEPVILADPQVVGTVTGRVIAERTGEPLASVQVYIAALDRGVLTQANGRYLFIDIPAGSYALTAERIGYRAETVEITVSDGQTFVQDFGLDEEALALDEVIVTGTAGGSQRRAIGNVVSRVDAGEISQSSAVRVEQVLGSGVPGVRMMAPAGAAGGEAAIRIRGSSSLSLSGDPLIYVDGVRINSRRAFDNRGSATSRLQDIDPSSIESIEIIKGPAAATLYGTEASNGVIQIFTKRGVEGETVLDVSAELGANWQPHPERNFGLQWYRDPTTGEIRNHNLYLLEQQPDRFGQPLFENGLIQRYSASIRGGTDLFRYYAALNRTDEEGFSRRDQTQGWTAQVSLTAVPTDEISLTINSIRTVRETEDAGTVMCSYACWAVAPAVDTPSRGAGRPYEAWLAGQTDTRTANRFTWSAEITHRPTEWFTHRLVGGIDDASLERVSQIPKGANGYAEFWGTAGEEGEKQLWQVDTPTRTLDYTATLSLGLTDDITSSTSVGVQWYSTEEALVYAQGEGFAVPALQTIGAAAIRESSETFVENTTVGTFVQNELGWADRRFLTLAVRFDDNSAFGTDFDAAIYPKISGSWVLSEEGFFPDEILGIGIDQLRIRGAWGESGKQPDAFAAQRLYEPETGPDGVPILTPQAFGNPNLGPETGSELELGLDATVLDGRVSVGFTWYRRVTKDAIVARPVRPSLGFPGTQFLNVGQTSNWGTETEVAIDVIQGGPVRWNVNLGLTTMGNRVDDLGGIGEIAVVALSGMPSRGQYHVEGFPIAGVFEKRVLSADFVSGNEGQVTNLMCDGGRGRHGREMGGPAVPCEQAPNVFWGGVDPTWQVHLANSWLIGDSWRLSATVDAQGGNVMIADYLAGQNTRFSEKFVKRDDPIFQANALIARAADVIHDAGFAKLREVALTYMLPESLLARIGASRASITASLYNVAVLWEEQRYVSSGQRIWDPEMVSPNFEYNGIATGAPPPMSHATVRMNVTF